MTRHEPIHTLAALGDLGDVLQGGQAVADLIGYIRTGIVDKQGPVTLGGGIQNALFVAKNTMRNGLLGSLPTTHQSAWDRWRAIAQPGESDSNIWWTFGQMVANWADRLIDAANAQPALVADPTVTRVSFTLVDTTQSGTTWYGGTVTSSKLTNPQWGMIFQKAWNVIARGVTDGVLPFSYLTVLCKGMLALPTSRHFPAFGHPEGDAKSPQAIAWRAMMKQLGWNDVVQQWFGYTQQAWAAENARGDQLDSVHAAAITALRYTSGAEIIHQLRDKVRQIEGERASALANMRELERVMTGPLGDYVSIEDKKTYEQIKRDFADAEAETQRVLGPAGLWPGSGATGLSAITLIVAGTIGVGLLGMCVWLLALWTSTSRAAADQVTRISTNVLATIDQVQQSCVRTYEGSAREAADEEQLRACLARSNELINAIPKVQTGGAGGLLALGVLGALGAGAYFMTRKRR
jgi:hypothetical protein